MSLLHLEKEEYHIGPLGSTNDLFAGRDFGFDGCITQIIQAVNSPHLNIGSPMQSENKVNADDDEGSARAWPTCCCIEVSEINLGGLRARRDPRDENEAAVLLEHA